MLVKIPYGFVALWRLQSTKSAESFRGCLRHFKSVIKPLDKASFQINNLFSTMKACAMSAKSS